MQDKSNEYFLGRSYDYWMQSLAHIHVWSWEGAPRPIRDQFRDGDEDGVAWIPNKFLDVTTGAVTFTPITQLWRGDDAPELVRYREGLLVIWRHA